MSDRLRLDLVLNDFVAAALTSVMILLFLGSWRSTVIIAVSIPLSILGSIIALAATGETLNLMTLGGLALAVGILVDDATVTIDASSATGGVRTTTGLRIANGENYEVRDLTLGQVSCASVAQPELEPHRVAGVQVTGADGVRLVDPAPVISGPGAGEASAAEFGADPVTLEGVAAEDLLEIDGGGPDLPGDVLDGDGQGRVVVDEPGGGAVAAQASLGGDRPGAAVSGQPVALQQCDREAAVEGCPQDRVLEGGGGGDGVRVVERRGEVPAVLLVDRQRAVEVEPEVVEGAEAAEGPPVGALHPRQL